MTERKEYGDSGEVLEEVLAYCRQKGIGSIVVACPGGLTADSAAWLTAQPEVKGMVLPPGNLPELDGYPVGRFVPGQYTWRLPAVSCSTIVHIGPRGRISFRMVRCASRVCGATRLVHGAPGIWRTEHVSAFVGKRVLERVLWVTNRLIEGCRNKGGAYCPVFVVNTLSAMQNRFNMHIRWQLRRFGQMAKEPLLPCHAFKDRRIVFVNSALAWGGAERQLVNTMVSLKSWGFDDISLVCENLDLSDDHQFFRHQLEGLTVESLGARGFSEHPSLPKGSRERLRSAVHGLPADLAEDVFRYAIHFLRHRPGVVHAWQDATSIKVGLAAVLVGVPRVVLSGRNMAPSHFSYYQYYMHPGYRLLAGFEQVRMVNNSHAGARDYERWLGLSGIDVIYNGLNEDFIRPASIEESALYRADVGIPGSAKVVGSIFRMYEEKDPLLWVQAAGEIARKRRDVFFLLVGVGPMKEALLDAAEKNGFSDRLVLPGTHENPAVPLSIMDVFLLASRYEGTPNVLMEAQKLGVPVVSTDAGGVEETILPGETGVVVRQRSPVLLADAVLEMLDDPVWKERAREKGPAFIQSRFGLERMVRETLDVYDLRQSVQTRVAS